MEHPGGSSPNLRWLSSMVIQSHFYTSSIEKLGKNINEKDRLMSERKKFHSKLKDILTDTSLQTVAFRDQWYLQVEHMLSTFFTHQTLAVMMLGLDSTGTIGDEVVVKMLSNKHQLRQHPKYSKELTKDATEKQTPHTQREQTQHQTTQFLQKKQKDLDETLSKVAQTRHQLSSDTESPNDSYVAVTTEAEESLRETKEHLQQAIDCLEREADKHKLSLNEYLKKSLLRTLDNSEETITLISEINHTELKMQTLEFRTACLKLNLALPVESPIPTRTSPIFDATMAEITKDAGQKKLPCEKTKQIGCAIYREWPEVAVHFL